MRRRVLSLLLALLFISEQAVPLEINWRDFFIGGATVTSLLIAKRLIGKMRANTGQAVGENGSESDGEKEPFESVVEHKKNFSDFVGQELFLKEIREYMKRVMSFRDMGLDLKCPLGLFIEGAAGSGKTLLSEALAGEYNVCLISITKEFFKDVSGDELKAKFDVLFDFIQKKREGHLTMLLLDDVDDLLKRNESLLEQIKELCKKFRQEDEPEQEEETEGENKPETEQDAVAEAAVKKEETKTAQEQVEDKKGSPEEVQEQKEEGKEGGDESAAEEEKKELKPVLLVLTAKRVAEQCGFFCRDRSIIDPEVLYEMGVEPILIPPLSPTGVKKVVQHLLKTVPLESEEVGDALAGKWSQELRGGGEPVISPKMIRQLIEVAIAFALCEGSEVVRSEHFEKAIMKVVLGCERDAGYIPEDCRLVAYHEAGHALLMLMTGYHVPRISIVPSAIGGGVTFTRKKPGVFSNAFKTAMLHDVIYTLGGYCAEQLMLGDVSWGASQDLMQANGIVANMLQVFGMSEEFPCVNGIMLESPEYRAVLEREHISIIQKCKRVVDRLLAENKDKLEKLADALIEKRVLYQSEIYELVGEPKNIVEDIL